MSMDKLFDGSDAHLLPGNAELIERLRKGYGDMYLEAEAADALEAADKRIAEERETYDRMLEEGAEKLFAAESEYKAMANLAAAYLRDKKEAERKLAVAREALEAAEWNSLDLPEFVRGKIVEALAQIGGDDAC